MAVTGHRSKDAVRIYKQTSVEQEESVSKILQSAPKKIRSEGTIQVTPSVEETVTVTRPTPVYHFNNCNVTFNNN